jgi:hypothetical protein
MLFDLDITERSEQLDGGAHNLEADPVARQDHDAGHRGHQLARASMFRRT